MTDGQRSSTHETYEEDTAKPTGGPPRDKSEPEGEAGSDRTPKTLTDPQTGAPNSGRPDTAGI